MAKPAREVGRARRALVACAWLLALGAQAGAWPARAGEPGDASEAVLDAERQVFERDMILRALAQEGLELDEAPEGKLIERVALVRLPIVEAADPWPDFVNLFHVTTREHIVRQELLFAEGEPYDALAVQESARNLRALPLVFSTVRIVTARGSRPDRVVVVVVTKDLWSIRLNTNGNFGGGVFNFFYATPSEQNFLGLNQQLSLHVAVDREVLTLGEIYRVPRLAGTRLALTEAAYLYVNHHSQGVEGGAGLLRLERPLFSRLTEWAFVTEALLDLGITRHFQGAGYRQLRAELDGTTYLLPDLHAYERVEARAQVTRSFGERWKTNLSAGWRLRWRRYELTPGLALLPEELRRAYRDQVMPLDESSGAAVVGLTFYEADYRRLENVQTLGLSEDFRFGPSAWAELAWANPSFGLSERSLRLGVGAGYSLLWGGDILALEVSGGARYMPSHGLAGVEGGLIDRSLEASLENVSPELFGLGRLFARVRYAYTQFSRDRALFSLGGDSTLRGFASGFRAGPRLLNVNVEFRSRPWVFYTVHLGFVAFYDGGDAYGFTRDTDFRYHQSAGVGLRGLVPQFDRVVFRLDMGIPLGADFHTRALEWFTLSVGQAF
ncbi:MAG TPA: BamA/TamA family outer membrane protein [Myxococcota bacterium]|nr:BamA/TamA family outer membrane protein [Myxococcota bacterium]HRY93359.1 BamA/TamA family outer membrane protein [Myxococcota bacterium]HSA20146.1 BamA/TamA family outer membrane protein [Myxococcota bacterium]